MSAPTRPVLRYHGGKWRLAPWLLSFFPGHRVYVEPFGGGGSVLMRKPRSYSEVYNDLDGEVVNVFRVLRDPTTCAGLQRAVSLTPYSRAEFTQARKAGGDEVERARRFLVLSFMGFGSDSATRKDMGGFRFCSDNPGSIPAHDWARWPEQLQVFTRRLRGLVIEHGPAVTIIRRHDAPDALFYCDPPYPHSTRADGKDRGQYRHEMSDEDHRALADALRSVEGMVVLSGYACELYDRHLFPDWRRFTRDVLGDSAKRRTEVVWLNPACSDALARGEGQGALFTGGTA